MGGRLLQGAPSPALPCLALPYLAVAYLPHLSLPHTRHPYHTQGLIKSAVFLPIYSRGAFNDPANPRQNFGALRRDSPCDNCLLEQRLALELKERGLVEKIYPVFVGRQGPDGAYERYILAGADADHPQASVEPVAAVEERLVAHLDCGFGWGE